MVVLECSLESEGDVAYVTVSYSEGCLISRSPKQKPFFYHKVCVTKQVCVCAIMERRSSNTNTYTYETLSFVLWLCKCMSEPHHMVAIGN